MQLQTFFTRIHPPTSPLQCQLVYRVASYNVSSSSWFLLENHFSHAFFQEDPNDQMNHITLPRLQQKKNFYFAVVVQVEKP